MAIEELTQHLATAIDQLKIKVLNLRKANKHKAAKELADQVRTIAQETSSYITGNISISEEFLRNQVNRLRNMK